MRMTPATIMAPRHAHPGAERRWAPRKKVCMPATILINGAENLSCTIRNTSSSGAQIETDPVETTIVEVAGQFTLTFTSLRTRTEVACRIVHRDGAVLGVRYVGPFHITDLTAQTKPKAKNQAAFGRALSR